jgi:tetratricopeptide (TPR) repeat protein
MRADIETENFHRHGAEDANRRDLAVWRLRRLGGSHLFLLFLLALTACGGSSAPPPQTARALPPANPVAAQKFLAASELMSGKKRDDVRAEALLKEALAIDGYLWEAHYNLGVLYRRRGELRKALEQLKAAHETQPAAREPLLALAETHHALGQPAAAAELLEPYLRAEASDPASRVAVTALLREQGKHDQALEQARGALIGDATNAAALLEVGRIYRAQGELDVSELVFRRALTLDEKSPRPHNELGLTALARGDTQLAFDHFETALRADPAFAPARLNRASVLLGAGDYAGAAAEYAQVLKQDPGHDGAQVGHAIALRAQGKHAEAAAEYQRVLARSPNQPEALYDLGVLQSDFLDQPKQAVDSFERYLAVAGDGPAREEAERYVERLQSRAAEAGK